MNIYVGNLPYTTTESELQQMFEDYGQVDSASIIRDRDSGQSRGFGFVEMPETSEAEAAIAALNGKDMGGRTLSVSEARPRPERRSGGGGGGRGGFSGGRDRGGRSDRGGGRRW